MRSTQRTRAWAGMRRFASVWMVIRVFITGAHVVECTGAHAESWEQLGKGFVLKSARSRTSVC
jgi:hypothetical protein